MNGTAPTLRPLYLFADSQLLFWKRDGRLLLESVIERSPGKTFRAAYIGASNGDLPEFYEIFAAATRAATEAVAVTAELRMIGSAFTADERAFLEQADLILLAGGDVRLGWETFRRTGIKDVILQRYSQGAVLVGISAGAVHLGRHGIVDTPGSAATELLDLLNLVPAVVDAHDESNDWARLSGTIHLLEGAAMGLGLPKGGGVMVHPDATIEPLRHPAHEFLYDGTKVNRSLLCPTDPT
jgi:cyanophycinase